MPITPAISATVRAAESPASAGFRLHHIQARTAVLTGLAWIGSKLSQRLRSSASSMADE